MVVSKNKFAVLTVAFIVAALICCSLYYVNFKGVAAAMTDTSDANTENIVVDEILKGKDSVNGDSYFDSAKLSQLYSAIGGSSAVSLSDINTALSGGQITSTDIRNNNKDDDHPLGRDIIVQFGGFKWTVTHVTKDRSGNIIATLWQAKSEETFKWNTWYADTPTARYPSNMYSSSYLRAVGLNSGGSGYIATNGATTLTGVAQNPLHKYAKFTMSSVAGSLTDFIVTPAQVAYQETENQNNGGTVGGVNYTLSNEAYGTPSGTVNWYNSNMNYSLKTGYTEWKDDYIWLPSLTETGYSTSKIGIWELSANQKSDSTYSWLRSGLTYHAGAAYALRAAGTAYYDNMVDNNYALRPALHLNLSAADNAAVYSVPSEISVDYDGTTHSLQSIMQNKGVYSPAFVFDSATQLSGVNADTYNAKVTLSSPHKWIVDDGGGAWHTEDGTVAKQIEWKIKPRQLTLTWSGMSSSYVWRSTLLADLQRYKPVIGGGVAIDNLDVQLTYDGSASNIKLDVAGAHRIKADIVTNNTASGAAALLSQNYIMPLANTLEYTYTVTKASQLAPILNIDYEKEELIPTNPTVNGQNRLPWLEYKDSNGNWQPIVGMKIPESIMTGDAVNFRYKVPAAYTDYIDDSGEYSLIIPERQEADEFKIDYAQETLFIDGGYSYIVSKSSPSGGYNQLITSTTLHLDQLGYIEAQGNQEYKVYYYKDATSTAFSSKIVELTIPARKDAPTFSINYKTEKTAQPANSNIRYIISGGSEQRGNGNLIDLNPDTAAKTLRAWYAADVGIFKSDEAVLNIPARPAKPVIEYDIATESYLNGNAPTADMEYRASTSPLWDTVNVAYKPMRGTYVYRYSAVEEDTASGITGAFASLESLVVDYGNKTVSVTVKWSDGIGGAFALAHTYNGNVIKPVAEFYTGAGNTERVPVPSGVIHYEIVTSSGRSENNPTDAEEYTVTVSIVDSTGQPDAGYSISDDTMTYKINKMQVKTLSLSSADRDKIVYNGSDIDITQYIPDYDGSYVNTSNAVQRNVSATDYTVRIRLANNNYEWDDGRAEDYIDIKWNIKPYAVQVMWDSTQFVADGNAHHPKASIVNFENGNINFEYSGDVNASKVHSGYSVSVSIARTDPNYLNYDMSNTTVTFDIILGQGMTLVFVEWTDSAGNAFTSGGSLAFNDAVQHPVVKITDGAGNAVTDAEVSYTDVAGKAITSKWTGSYSVKISIDTGKYAIDGACSEVCDYVIAVNSEGKGEYKIISIEIGGNYKKNYAIGESFDSYGMTVYGIYPDGERTELGSNDYSYTGGEELVEGDNTVTVSYGELSASIVVKAGELVEGGVVSGKWVSIKMFAICISAIGVLTLICVILAAVIVTRLPSKRAADNVDVNEADIHGED